MFLSGIENENWIVEKPQPSRTHHQTLTPQELHHLRFHESGVQVAMKINLDIRPEAQDVGIAAGRERQPEGAGFCRSWTSWVCAGLGFVSSPTSTFQWLCQVAPSLSLTPWAELPAFCSLSGISLLECWQDNTGRVCPYINIPQAASILTSIS